MKRNITCITCPLGCEMQIEYQDKKVLSIRGNSCPRGEKYAESEIVSPVRTVTTTIKTECGLVCPVKTEKPIPKEKIFECMKIINSFKPTLPIIKGSVIIKDVFGTNIIATSSIDK